MSTPIYLELLYAPFLLWIAIIDFREHRIPNVIVVPLILVAFVVSFLTDVSRYSLIGGLVGLSVFLLPVFLYGPKRAGMGDVKYGLFVGLATGWPYVICALFITFFLALLFSSIGIISKRIEKDTSIPMAPFITVGTLICFWLF